MANKNVLFLLSSSISAYKACDVISKLRQESIDIQCVTSYNFKNFIGTSTLEGLSGKAVFDDEFQSSRNMDHIHLVRKADLIVLCPATAQTINAFASGTGGILTSLFLAHDFKKPFLIYPAMNTAMYQHPRTQQSLAYLKEIGIEIMLSPEGVLACGEQGQGRLQEPHIITEDILTRLNK